MKLSLRTLIPGTDIKKRKKRGITSPEKINMAWKYKMTKCSILLKQEMKKKEHNFRLRRGIQVTFEKEWQKINTKYKQ